MAHVSPVPFEQIDPEVQQIMQTYDKEYGGSAFLQAFAHAPEVFKSFVNYYFPLIFETRGSIDMQADRAGAVEGCGTQRLRPLN